MGRSVFPFGVDAREFFERLEAVCRRTNAVILFRSHLNSRGGEVAVAEERVIPLPFAAYPDTEGLLQLADVLICDWSSIAFDYLLLDRPTIFLDVEPPFDKGFSLGREYRFGAIASDMEALLSRLERSLVDAAAYEREFSARHVDTRTRVYANYADGHSSERCAARLQEALARSESSR